MLKPTRNSAGQQFAPRFSSVTLKHPIHHITVKMAQITLVFDSWTSHLTMRQGDNGSDQPGTDQTTKQWNRHCCTPNFSKKSSCAPRLKIPSKGIWTSIYLWISWKHARPVDWTRAKIKFCEADDAQSSTISRFFRIDLNQIKLNEIRRVFNRFKRTAFPILRYALRTKVEADIFHCMARPVSFIRCTLSTHFNDDFHSISTKILGMMKITHDHAVSLDKHTCVDRTPQCPN